VSWVAHLLKANYGLPQSTCKPSIQPILLRNSQTEFIFTSPLANFKKVKEDILWSHQKSGTLPNLATDFVEAPILDAQPVPLFPTVVGE
jgi:hypothetical protein